MITQLLDQFLSLTFWGPLDYLILDMPPGTGDIQLTLSQKMNITAAVIVTTPQELSFVDVERGIQMFDSVNVPCVSVVENMAYLETDVEPKFDERIMSDALQFVLKEKGIDDTHLAEELVSVVKSSLQDSMKQDHNKLRIFGKGHKKRLSDQWGIEHTFSIPLMEKIAANGDSGTPFVMEYPNSEQAAIYKDLAGTVAREVVKVQYANNRNRPTIAYNSKNHLLEISIGNEDDKDTGTMPPADLRRECKCAACVEEFSGRQILKPEDILDSVIPASMNPTGNYALSVDWSDGHKSLYPYKQIRSLLKSTREARQPNL
jgi:MinD-like ATPase involved in chromosome partitioning or flagellar assembly